MDFIKQFYAISEEEYRYGGKMGKIRRFKKNEVVFPEGKPFTNMLFIFRGLVRSYHIVDNKEVTFNIFAPRDFACDFTSYLLEKPTPFRFVALTDTVAMEWTKASINEIYTKYPGLERFGRLMAENAYLRAVNRAREFQTDDLEKRYLKLMDRNPDLFQQVPQHYIASMLGVQPQSLSRIKAKLAGKK